MADPIQGERLAVRALLPATGRVAAISGVVWIAADLVQQELPTPASISLSVVHLLLQLVLLVARSATIASAFLFVILLLHRLVNRQVEPAAVSQQPVLSPSAPTLSFSWPFQSIAFLFLAFAIASFPVFFFPSRDLLRASLVAFFFMAIAAYSFATMNFPRVVVLPSGLHVRLFRDRRDLSWADITSARIEKDNLLVTPRTGKALKLSMHLRHIDLLLDELERRLVQAAVTPN